MKIINNFFTSNELHYDPDDNCLDGSINCPHAVYVIINKVCFCNQCKTYFPEEKNK